MGPPFDVEMNNAWVNDYRELHLDLVIQDAAVCVKQEK